MTVESNPSKYKNQEKNKRRKSSYKNRMRKNKLLEKTGPLTLNYKPEIHSHAILSPNIPKSKLLDVKKNERKINNRTFSVICKMNLQQISPYIDIIHCNENIIILNKPAGISSCASNNDTLLDIRNLMKAYILKHKDFSDWMKFLETPSKLDRLYSVFDGNEIEDEQPFCGIIHLVDKQASGIIVFGRHSKSTNVMNDMFADQRVKKTFIVCVKGSINEDVGTLQHFIAETKYSKVKILSPEKLHAKLTMDEKNKRKKDSSSSVSVVGDIVGSEGGITEKRNSDLNIKDAEIMQLQEMVVANSKHNQQKKGEKWKFAKMKYERMLTFEVEKQKLSLLKITTYTQRQHQIRAQLAYEGMPILGDDKYCRKSSMIPFMTSDKEMTENNDLLAMHLWFVEYECPFDHEKKMIEAPLPNFWVKKFGSQIISQTFDH